MSLSNDVSTRKNWCDFMRGILMFLVFLYHSEVYFDDHHSWSYIFQPFFLTGFIFVSGYLFSSNISQVKFTSKIKQTLRTIIIPYFLFMAVLFLPKCLFITNNTSQMLLDVFLFRASWFVVVIGVLQIIYGFLFSREKSILKNCLYTGFMFLLGYLIVTEYNVTPNVFTSSQLLDSKLLPGRLPFCINMVLILSPFFYLGIVYRIFENKIIVFPTGIKSILLITLYLSLLILDHKFIGTYINIVSNRYHNLLLIFIYAILGIYCLITLSKWIQKINFINYLGKKSLIFYYLNGAALTFIIKVNDYCSFMIERNYLNIFIIAVCACAFVYPISYIITHYLPFFVGDKESYRKYTKKLGYNIKW